MRQLLAVIMLIVAISGCIHMPGRPYCKKNIANAALSYFRDIEEDNSTYIFSKRNGEDKFQCLDRMFADTDGFSDAYPECSVLEAKLRKKLMQGNADMFYACDDDYEVFFCVDYDADETNSREYESGSLTWRWYLLYPFFHVTYDLHTHKFVEMGYGDVSGWDIEGYLKEAK